MIEFLMPSLGADMEAGTLIEWKKKPGDTVKRGDIIAEVETQKGLIEIEVFDEGIIGELLIPEGAKVPVGTALALINPSGIASEPEEEEKIPEKKPVALQPTEERILEPISLEKTEEIHTKASPFAKRIAFENQIDLSLIKGTGPEGAITKEDVEKTLAQRDITEKEKTQEVAVAPEKPGTVAESIRTAVAAAMSKSNREIPHYYLGKRIDMTNALTWLKEVNSKRTVKERLLPVVLLIKATAQSLTEFPDLNAIWDDGLQQKKDINIGFVVSLRSGGIIVPAIHQASLKNVDEIMEALNDIIPRARALKLRSSELSDSTVTITNIGDGGADTIFGVIYPPQVAIIGFGSISEQPFAQDGMLGIRSSIFVTLAGDHRATDGLTGSGFLVSLNKYLQNPESL
ncbi:dihydrolipoamide acetyltransferase family protein [Flavobacterium caseinilyticum]|uniref:Dihydrolipoamide acetyltransferase component of pyruvate dehydrogenase complex n=1 Tax=Flavobacterium caseinilyticum TaxID=2541732 RepID=A0A4R5AY16_9FLAO|nr:dihydrolipoamide acetyltransferase family protein [Flavobacterium caseinilyticum]TDD76979.1 2-oxo acid dehydrogenase subunit E2 [Flavobacterium caseinilyticum]